jgi:glycosyltransferase involved in cell wall biosynthesis
MMTPCKPASVVYLGLDDFPLGLAETQKVRLVSRALIGQGCRVSLVSRWWSSGRWRDTSGLKPSGTFEGIEYLNASGHLYRPGSWLERKRARLRGLAGEIRALARLHSVGHCDLGIVSTGTFSRVIYYRLLSWLLGFPLVLHLVEDYEAMFRDAPWKKRLNAWLFDRYACRMASGVLPISRSLIDRVEHYAPGKPWLKDPGLVDLSRFDGLVRKPGKPYLLFCGYLGYMEIIRFILEAFDLAETDPSVEFRLVLNGAEADFARFDAERQKLRKADRVVVISGISDRELSQLYLDAYALVIPLRQTPQDRARFPHKIGEYCASRRPVITTAVGEVGERFTDGLNAFVAARYDAGDFARAFEAALADPARADEVGAAGRRLAEEQFDYRRFGPPMKEFVEELAGLSQAETDSPQR